MPAFTPTEQRILKVLADGESHHRSDVLGAIGDELADLSTLQVHLSNIRVKLRPNGQDILCVLVRRQIHYRWVRVLVSPYKE